MISCDFGVVFEQIAVQNMKNVQWTFDSEAENKRATRLSDKQQDAEPIQAECNREFTLELLRRKEVIAR